MKRVLFFAVASLVAAGTASFAVDTLPGGLGKELQDPEKLKDVIESGDPKYVVVDIRTEPEYERGHIPTAVCIPYGRTTGVQNPPGKDRYIIVYCNTGVRSGFAAEQMLADGYKYVLDWGGIWEGTFSEERAWPYELQTSKGQSAKPATKPSWDEGC